MRKPILGTVFLLFLASFAFSANPVKEIILPGKVRDFLESTSGGHVDFNGWGIYAGCKGAVASKIGTSGQISVFPGDNRNPVYVGGGDCPPYFHGAGFFDQWYNDQDASINRPFLVPLRFQLYDDCGVRFSDSIFYPIDDGKEMYPLRDPSCALSDPNCATFGHRTPAYSAHNYSFTLEFHTTFTYKKNTGQIFAFTGDDDVWVYVNDSLVIDLGGVHSQQSATINLDTDLPSGFLVDGNTYNFDFFSAERNVFESNIRIWTSIMFNPEMGGSTTITCNNQPQTIGTPAWPPAWYTEWKNPTISGFVTGLTTIDGLEGATVAFSGQGTSIANWAGAYTKKVPAGWTGTITPSKPGFSFNPVSRQLNSVIAGQSNINFQGTDTLKPTAKLTAPNGGESWIAGSTQKITWDSASDNSTITTRSIYWRKNNQAWQLLNTANSNGAKGDWSWVLPQDTCDICWAKIEFTDKTGNKGVDSSNLPFRIGIAPHFTSPDTATVTSGTMMQFNLAYQNPTGGSVSFALLPGSPSWLTLTAGNTILTGIPPAGNGEDTAKVLMSVNGIPYDTLELVIKRTDPNASMERIGFARTGSFGIRSGGTASAHLMFYADLPKAGAYRIALTNVSGRKIYSSSLNAAQPGSYKFQINGHYAQVLRNSGIVLVALEGMGQRTVLRQLLVR